MKGSEDEYARLFGDDDDIDFPFDDE